MISRDYLRVCVWDVRNNKMPVKALFVNDYLDRKLCDVYENETIFDKFDLQVSPCGNYALTGSYNSNVHIIDLGQDG